jgi:hypothetical protein
MSIKVTFIDTLRNAYEQAPLELKPKIRDSMKSALTTSFADDIDAMVDRWLEPPSMGVIDVTNTKFTPMLMESLMNYVYGFYYSTISSCGITGERLCMDILLRRRFALDGKVLSPNDLEPLFSIPHVYLVNLLFGWHVIDDDARKKLLKINDIRNKYVHPDVIPDLESGIGKEELKKDALEILSILKEVLSWSFPYAVDLKEQAKIDMKKLGI